jgi:hypothetical protein
MKSTLACSPVLLFFLACGGGDDGPVSPDASDGDAAVGCTLTANTTATGEVAPTGCALLDRDTGACEGERTAAGLSGYWLDFSCRVQLISAGGSIQAVADGLPDYMSNYFPTSDVCWEEYDEGQNPNRIAVQSYTLTFPTAPDMTSGDMMPAVVGLAVNGVPIYDNRAAPGDDIYEEALTFDRCAAHPQMAGAYHYHSEPFSISYDDDRFIGVMRDGYPIYGRRDMDGTMPALDEFGGHTGATPHSPTTPVYHYHVNEQTSTNAGTLGEKQWFLTTGMYRGTPGTCTGCGL